MIYEEDNLNKMWDSEWMKFNRAVDKLKRMRLKVKRDEEEKNKDGTPTSIDLENQFNLNDKDDI